MAESNTQKTWASIVGVLLILIGVFGPFGSTMMGIFSHNILHNIMHIITGIIFVWVGRSSPKRVNRRLGIIYALIAFMGFLGIADFIGIYSWSDSDNYFHMIVGALSIAIGYGYD